MSNKNSGLNHIKTKNTKDDVIVSSEESDFILPLSTEDLSTKTWKKFLTNCKSLVRSSIEYKKFIGDCKRRENGNYCAFLGNISEEDVTIEIHHSPFTIHEIIEIIANHMICEKPIMSLLLCHEVMNAHFNNLVGVVPLSETIHQLVHAGKINISIYQIYGDILEFIKRYKNGITLEHLEKVQLFLELSKEELHEENLLKVNQVNNEYLAKTDNIIKKLINTF